MLGDGVGKGVGRAGVVGGAGLLGVVGGCAGMDVGVVVVTEDAGGCSVGDGVVRLVVLLDVGLLALRRDAAGTGVAPLVFVGGALVAEDVGDRVAGAEPCAGFGFGCLCSWAGARLR